MVGDVRVLRALLGDTSSVLSEGFFGFFLALAEVPRIAWENVGPFEVSLENSDEISPVVDLVGR
jgi:hypothetical protein